MSRETGVVAGSGSGSILPTAYTITDCVLTSNSGKEYNILALIAEIDIVESLDMDSIDVQLGIRDAIQFLESAKISGNEKIFLKIKHTTLEKNQKTQKKYELDLRLVEITNFVRPKPGTQIYRFICMKEHMYTNAIKKLVRPFEGPIGTIISNIVKKDLKIEKIGTVNTETKGILKGIFPRLDPLSAIEWLCRNAYDNQTPFFFYDTLAEGIIFDSYANFCKSEVEKEYIQRPFMQSKAGTDEHYKEISEQITKLSSNMNSSQLVSLHNGAYASTLHTLDLSTKKYNTFFYDYAISKPQKLNDHRPYNTETDVDGIKYDKTIDSKHYFVSLNDKSFELDNYHSPTVPTLMTAEGIKENLNLQTHTITVAGNYSLTPGKKISITIPKSLGIDATGIKDKFITGNYIVHGIRHSFKELYTMQVDVIKDSNSIDLDGEPM